MRVAAAVLIGLAGALAVGLALENGPPPPEGPTATAATAAASPSPSPSPRPARHRHLPRARCPAEAPPGCVAVRGPVVYVERVDPDGDGDLHVVVLGGHVTAPGTTAIDVARDLRPARDPRIGDVVAAAGPVQTGHLGQSQIHALVFRTRRSATP